MTSKHKKEGWALLLSGKNFLKSIALAGGVALHAINVYLSTTILPSVIKDIGGLEYYAWNTTIFVVASIIGSLFSAKSLAEQGPKAAYRTAIIIFSIGTAICTMAPNMAIMLVGRFVQGIGGGLLFAHSYAMIRVIFEETLWPRAMALVSGMWGVAAFSGPFIGGVFAQYDIWRASFGSLIIISLLLVIITERILPKKDGKGHHVVRISILKMILLSGAALAVSVGSIQEGITPNMLGVVGAVVLISLLIISEKNSNRRLLPDGAYKISTAIGSTYFVMILLTIASTMEIFVPYFAQVIYNFSPLKAGYLTVLMALGWTFSSIVFSGVKQQTVRTLLFIGPALMSIGLLGLAVLMPHQSNGSGFPFVIICVCLGLIGLGIGMGWPHLLTKVMSSAPAGQEEIASSSISTVQLMSTAFGASLGGLIANLSGMSKPGGLYGAQNSAYWLFALFAIAPALALVIRFVYRRIQVSKKVSRELVN